MTSGMHDLLADLTAEYDRLETMLRALDDVQWATPSAADGWSVADVMVHLLLTEETVLRSIAGGGGLAGGSGDEAATGADPTGGESAAQGSGLEAGMAAGVQAAGLDGPAAFARWRTVRRRSVAALAEADPDRPLPWAAAPLKPRTLATTRLAEHWAHALDIAEGLGIDLPDTARLRHVAWLGHATLPYAFGLAGLEPVPVRAELAGPDGHTWTYGPDGAATLVTGPAGAFCRVGARRLRPDASGLVVTGPGAENVLRLLRNWA
jgi:uncharacterized protein (TIGR03084 family)